MKYRRRKRARFLVLALALAATAARGAPPTELYRREAQAPFAAGETVQVSSGPLQVSLAPGLVLSAATGAEFLLVPTAGGAPDIHVGIGQVLLVDLARNTVARLPPGSYRAAAATGIPPQTPPFERQDFRFGDYILVRQQEYLDKVGISIEPLNRAILGFIRGFFRSSR